MTFLYKAAAMFVALFVLDYVWAWYTKSVSRHKINQASIASALIYLVGGLTTIQYVNDPWLLVPAIVGGMTGTYCALYFDFGAGKNEL